MLQVCISGVLARAFFERYKDLRRKQGKLSKYERFED